MVKINIGDLKPDDRLQHRGAGWRTRSYRVVKVESHRVIVRRYELRTKNWVFTNWTRRELNKMQRVGEFTLIR